MADKKKAILLRIPPDLWDSLNWWARDEIRSLNAQIEFVLREAVRRRSGRHEPDLTHDRPGGTEEDDQASAK